MSWWWSIVFAVGGVFVGMFVAFAVLAVGGKYWDSEHEDG